MYIYEYCPKVSPSRVLWGATQYCWARRRAVSVRDCLLAIMSLGPQYGLQLHAELTTRAPHRAATNVGQIYSTLDRLVRDAKVETGGQTADGLPLYQLTEL